MEKHPIPAANPNADKNTDHSLDDGSLNPLNIRSAEILMDTIRDGVVILNADFVIQRWNKGAEELYGWKEKEAIGKVTYEFLQTNFGSTSLEDLKEKINTQGYYRKELIQTTKSGDRINIFVSASSIPDQTGKPLGIIAIYRNITNKKRKEKELLYHAALVENIRDAVLSIDKDYQIVSWNKGAENIYGWKAAEVIGKIVYELLNSDLTDISIEKLKKTLDKTGYFNHEVTHTKKNGEKVFGILSVSVIYDEYGEVAGRVAIVQDISELKKRENQLIYHSVVMENIIDALFSIDINYAIKSWNKGAEELYGWKEEEVIGKISYELLQTDYSPHTFEAVLQTFQETGAFRGDIHQITKSGKQVMVNMSTKALHDTAGNIIGAVTLNKDISETHKNIIRLNALSENLKQQVALQTKELTNIFERVTDGFAALDKDWNYTYMNKTAGAIFHCEPEKMIGKYIWQEFPESIGRTFHASCLKAMDSQQSINAEDFYPVHKRWIEFNIYPSLGGVSIYFRDVTDKKNADKKLEKANRLYQFISSINQMIIRTTDKETLFGEACKIAIDEGKFKMAWIGILDERTKSVNPVMYDGIDLEYLSIIQIIASKLKEEGNGPTGRAILEGTTQFCNDIETDPRMNLWREEAMIRGYFASISIPIMRFGKVYGSFNLYSGHVNFFDEEEIALLEKAANDISFALDFIEKEIMRKRTLDSLIKSERRYQALTEVSPAGIFHTNRDGLVTYVNPKWLFISGLTFPEALGNGWVKAIFAEDREPLKAIWNNAIEKENAAQFEFRFQRPDNSIAWVIAQTIPERDSQNRVIGYVGTTTDITEYKNAEEKVITVLTEKETILNRINDSMISLNKDWKYTFINNAALARHPETREEILGKTFWEINPGLKGTSFETMYLTAMETQTVGEIEDFYPPMNIWFNIKAYPSTDGITVLFKDVTESRKFEDSILTLNNQLNLSQKIAKIGYWEIDLIGGNNFWSDEMYQLCEIERDGRMITIDDFNSRIHQDDRDNVSQLLRTLIGDKKDFVSIEYRFLSKDGSIKHMLSSGQAIINSKGEANRIIGTMQDITDRKNIELEIIKEKYLSESVIDNLPGIFYIIDQKGQFIRWNKNLEDLMQYSKEEIGKMNRLDLAIEADKEKIASVFSAPKSNDKQSALTQFVTNQGKLIPFHLSTIAIEYKGESCLMIMGIDFSERAKILEEMNQTSMQLQALTDHLQNVREEERKRIGRELHDELGQQLTAMKMDIAWINKKTPDDAGLIKEKMLQVIEMLDGSNTALRRILNELRPSILDQHGLLEALQWQGSQFTTTTNIPFELRSTENEIKVKDEIATCIFRVFQESLTNITRYAEAKKVTTLVEVQNSAITIEIMDNGKGFDTGQEQPKSRQPFGIMGMKERVRALNGNFVLESIIGKGTKIQISLPLDL